MGRGEVRGFCRAKGCTCKSRAIVHSTSCLTQHQDPWKCLTFSSVGVTVPTMLRVDPVCTTRMAMDPRKQQPSCQRGSTCNKQVCD